MSTLPRPAFWLCAPLLVMLAACAAPASEGDTADACEGADCDPDASTSDVIPVDTGSDEDTGALTDTDDGDTGDIDDTADIDDAADVDVEQPCDGTLGCPCIDDLDCESGICINTGDEQVCTEFCTDTCTEPDWECRVIRGSGGDVIEICIPPADVLCSPCDADLDCGSETDRCVELLDGPACATACDAADACPTGFVCQDLGAGDRQCIPELGVCGGCYDQDGDLHGIGPECLGSDCDDLEESVFEGAGEICDNLDNNCNDVVDEGFDLQTDLRHCGACGNACSGDNATMACVAGQCTVESCDEGYADCNLDPTDGCEVDLLTSLEHCGECSLACAPDNAVAECVEGICSQTACIEPFADCDRDGLGCEADLTSSLEHCGACDAACAPPNAVGFCGDAVCSIAACTEGFADCDATVATGCEISLLTDPTNCLGCGEMCDLANVDVHVCSAGGCGIGACDAGWEDCNLDPTDGCEIRTATNVDNCGACGAVCEVEGGAPACVEGVCQISSCEAPAADCNADPADGCEVALNRDLDNCGFCGFVCDDTNVDEQQCRAGVCEIDACDAGYDDCNDSTGDGCEQDVWFDLDNCGGCDISCRYDNAATSCLAGRCIYDGCDPGYVDLDGVLDNGCEYECTVLGSDVPDDGFIDFDCDGVDGPVDQSVFVRAGASASNDGLSPDSPLPTIAAGLSLAEALNRPFVLVASGAYEEGRLVVDRAVSIFGGYATDFRSRDDSRAVVTSTDHVAAVFQNLTSATRVDRVDFVTNNQSSAGQETRTVVIDNVSTNLTLTNVRIRAGSGGPGTAGADGGNGGAGANGFNASGSSGGNPGGNGGRGASGRRQAAGPAGSNGGGNSGCSLGDGGSGSGSAGLGCADGNPRDGGRGENGCPGSAGSNGLGGNATGNFIGTDWVASNGLSGTAGSVGGGGGGGGAGGGEDCTAPLVGCLFCGTGRGGGGGAGGGAGGSAGSAGGGGGASIGMVLRGSTVRVDNVRIETSGGGRGGDGGGGGTGGSGGSGGEGVRTSSDTEGSGGDGGDGGLGGRGGCGGGGGGGPSVGVWILTGDLTEITPVTYSIEVAGAGGASCGNSGASGVSGSVYP